MMARRHRRGGRRRRLEAIACFDRELRCAILNMRCLHGDAALQGRRRHELRWTHAGVVPNQDNTTVNDGLHTWCRRTVTAIRSLCQSPSFRIHTHRPILCMCSSIRIRIIDLDRHDSPASIALHCLTLLWQSWWRNRCSCSRSRSLRGPRSLC